MVSTENRHLPPIENVKKLQIFTNGDPSFSGKRMNFNKKQIPSFDSFLTEVTKTINPRFGAVRQLYTPNGTRKLSNIADIDKYGLSYVAAGKEKFVRIDYLGIAEQLNLRRQPPRPGKQIVPVKHSRIVASGRIKKVHNIPVVIFVHANGNDLENSHRIRLLPRQQVSWETVLNTIAESVKLRYGGAIRKVYTTDGREVHSTQELDNYGTYVAVDKFNKFVHCSYPGSKSSSLSSSPRIDNRRAYPHGLKLVPLRDRKGASLETSSTSSQPSTASNKKKGPLSQVTINDTFELEPRGKPKSHHEINFQTDRNNRYKSTSKNKYTTGAEVITDSKFTKVEYPIDERKAEPVQDEIIHVENTEEPIILGPPNRTKVAKVRANGKNKNITHVTNHDRIKQREPHFGNETLLAVNGDVNLTDSFDSQQSFSQLEDSTPKVDEVMGNNALHTYDTENIDSIDVEGDVLPSNGFNSNQLIYETERINRNDSTDVKDTFSDIEALHNNSNNNESEMFENDGVNDEIDHANADSFNVDTNFVNNEDGDAMQIPNVSESTGDTAVIAESFQHDEADIHRDSELLEPYTDKELESSGNRAVDNFDNVINDDSVQKLGQINVDEDAKFVEKEKSFEALLDESHTDHKTSKDVGQSEFDVENFESEFDEVKEETNYDVLQDLPTDSTDRMELGENDLSTITGSPADIEEANNELERIKEDPTAVQRTSEKKSEPDINYTNQNEEEVPNQ